MEMARRMDADIVSVDSMQVYRGMDIGTDKPTPADRARVVHHLVDIADPSDEVSVAQFQEQGRAAMEGARGSQIICGGSGLHFRSLVDPMSFAPTDPSLREELETWSRDSLVSELLAADPGAGDHIDLANHRRLVRAVEIWKLGAGTPTTRSTSDEAMRLRGYEPDIAFSGFGIDPGPLLESRVDERLASMQARGLVDEVRLLMPSMGRTARSAIGYREVADAFESGRAMEEAFREIRANTLKLVRRQRTWFHRDPRIRWIPWSEDPVEMTDQIEGLMV